MDLMVDVLSNQPWGITRYEHKITYTIGWRGDRGYKNIPVDAQYMLVKDSSKSYWKRADLVKFRNGYYWSSCMDDWKSWFLSEEAFLDYLDKHENNRRNKEIPFYARSEFALIVSRYKWKKDKMTTHNKVYHDYGTIILMLTGSKAGHMRKYYNKIVFNKISRYPYDHITPFYYNKGVRIPEELLPRIHEAMNYANGNKDRFILNMIASYHDENYFKNMEENHGHTENFRYL